MSMQASARILRIISAMMLVTAAIHSGYASSISGRVLTNAGQSQAGQIRLFRLKVQDGHVDELPDCTADLDSRGMFSCSITDSGQYLVEILATDALKPGAKEPVSPLPFFYPGVTDLALATPVDVDDSTKKWLDIRVPSTRLSNISGALKQFPTTAYLRLEAEGNDLLADTTLPVQRIGEGRFVVTKVPSGHYVLSAVWREKTVPHRVAAHFTVDGKNVSMLVLRQESYGKLHGVLTGDHADRVKTLLIYSEDNKMQKIVADVQDGQFNVTTLPVGRYYLALPIHSQEFISSVKQGNRESVTASVLVMPDGVTTLQVAIDMPGVEIIGAVPDVSGLHTRARIVVQDATSGHVATVLSDDLGKFSVSGLQPGQYRLFAWPETEDPAYRSVDVLKRMERNSTNLSVEKGLVTRSEDLPLLHPAQP